MKVTYEELKSQKAQGKELKWEDISKEQLSCLFYENNIPDSLIADLYDTTKSKVSYKRKKWNIKMFTPEYYYKKLNEEDSKLLKLLNNRCKDDLLNGKNLEWLPRAITHYIFRNGPIEDMHANKQLSQKDMKTLNKYMVNKIATLLSLVNNEEWYRLEIILRAYGVYGQDWDKPEIDTKEVEMLIKSELNLL